MSPSTRPFPRSSAGVLLVHAAAFPFIALVSWLGAGSMVELLFRLPFPPEWSVLIIMACVAALLHVLVGRWTAGSHGIWRTARGHLARCAPAYLVVLVCAWVIVANHGVEGFQWIEPFFGFAIAVGAGELLGDAVLLLWYRTAIPLDKETSE